MAQFIVRDLEEDVKTRLKRRAERYGRSMEEEATHILRIALKQANRPAPRLGSRIAARFAKIGLTADLPEFHGPSICAIRRSRASRSRGAQPSRRATSGISAT